MHTPTLTVALAALLAAGTALARVPPWTPTDAEFRQLPPYCVVKMKQPMGSPEYRNWESILGRDFVHVHHYCAGLNFLNRYYRATNPNEKRFNLQNARSNFEYMVTHAQPGFSLMPDVYLNLGVVAHLAGQTAQALTHLEKALALDPRQPRVYLTLADHYQKRNEKTRALEVVTEGLRHNPDTRSLQRRYRELGGKLPYPDPIVAAAPEPVPQAAEPSPVTATATGQATDPDAKPPVQRIEPRIGSPTNPYCRFCVD